MADPSGVAQQATEREDPFALVGAASQEELEKLHLAEEIFEKRHTRRKRSTRVAIASQALVGYVAFAGLLVNAYQSYANSQKQLRQQQQDSERWNKEFERAKEADKYRAFFETSALATDPTNADRRLVGYALLDEFVQDKEYNSKATLMLEESLLQELRGDTADSGLDEAHSNAVLAILTALSQTSDCHALERPARSIAKIARRHSENHDLAETQEVFGVYVRRIVGRAAQICPTMKDFRAVRAPIQEMLLKIPEAGGLKGHLKVAQANRGLAAILHERCNREIQTAGSAECMEVYNHYVKLCSEKDVRDDKDEQAGCDEIKAAAAEAAKIAATLAANSPPPDAGTPEAP